MLGFYHGTQTPATIAFHLISEGPSVRPKIYDILGIDPDMPVHDRSGRPIAVAQGGRPIREIMASSFVSIATVA